MQGVGASELLVILCICGVVLLPLLAVGLIFMLRKRGASSPSREGPAPGPPAEPARSTHTVFYLQLPQDQADDVRSIVSGQPATLRGSGLRDAALALIRLTPYATHAYAGPARDAGAPARARSPAPGGVLVGLRARTATPLDTVRDDTDATSVKASLSELASLPDAQILDGAIALAQHVEDPAAPLLVAVRDATRPGMRQCSFCFQPMPVYETICPHCGGRA